MILFPAQGKPHASGSRRPVTGKCELSATERPWAEVGGRSLFLDLRLPQARSVHGAFVIELQAELEPMEKRCFCMHLQR